MKNRAEDENNSFLAMANGKKGARNRPSILGRLHGCPGLIRIELRQAGRLGSGILAQILLVNDAILADQSVGKCLCGELKPLNYFRRPGVFLPHAVERNKPKRRPRAHPERKVGNALEPEVLNGLPVPDCLGGQLRRGRKDNDFPCQQLIHEIGEILRGVYQIRYRRTFKAPIKMSDRYETLVFGQPLPKSGQVQSERIADLPLSVQDFPVHISGREASESRGNIGQ